MSETPTATTPATRSKSAYLPVLPEGWTYHLSAAGPRGATAEILTHADGDVTVEFNNGSEVMSSAADDFPTACKVLANGVKVLDQVSRGEEQVRIARENALSVLGTKRVADPAGVEPVSRSTAPADN